MKHEVASIVSNSGVITLMYNGSNYTIGTEHRNYEKIKEALALEEYDNLADLVDAGRGIAKFSQGKVQVVDGEVLYQGEPVHNVVTDRLLSLMENGFPFKPLARFLENLMENPSARAVSELYDFLQNKNLPITEDGCFLAYKGTRADGYDRYSGTILNEVGQVIEIPRNKVDDDRAHECSYGLHVGAMEYVKWYCTDRVIIVKVNPKDCVSVPRDHNAQKLRVCRYEVLSLYEGDLTEPLYDAEGQKWDHDAWEKGYPEDWNDVDFEDDEDWDDEDWDDEEWENDDLSDDLDVDVHGYGRKPDGSLYHNVRDSSGKFSKKS